MTTIFHIQEDIGGKERGIALRTKITIFFMLEVTTAASLPVVSPSSLYWTPLAALHSAWSSWWLLPLVTSLFLRNLWPHRDLELV